MRIFTKTRALMEESDSIDLTMFDESSDLRPLSRSSSMGFCHSEGDMDFDDLGFDDGPSLVLKIDATQSKLLDADEEEIEDGLDFPEDLADFGERKGPGTNPEIVSNPHTFKGFDDTKIKTEIGQVLVNEDLNDELQLTKPKESPSQISRPKLMTISLEDFQKSSNNQKSNSGSKIDHSIIDFGDSILDDSDDWKPSFLENNPEGFSSNGTLNSPRISTPFDLDSISNFGDDLDNISDLEDGEIKESPRAIDVDVAAKLAKFSETVSDNFANMEECIVSASLKLPPPKQSPSNSKLGIITKSRNTINLLKPMTQKKVPVTKQNNSNFAKPPLKSSRISSEFLPRQTTTSTPKDKEKTAGVKKATYKVVFGRTILIEPPKPKLKKVQSKPTLIRNLTNCDQPKGTTNIT